MTGCPSEEVMAGFLSGQLKPAPATALYHHLESCPSCRQLVSLLISSGQRSSIVEETIRSIPESGGPMMASHGELPPRFEIQRCLGMGGMGVVFEVIDRRHGRRIALKSIGTALPSVADTQGTERSSDLLALRGELVERFKREFRVLRSLSHPNLISLGELLEEEGRWLITMELIDGVDLLTYVRTAGPQGYDEQRLRRALAQLASGLCAIHRAGLVHRDVKPANALVTREGRVVLLDFGLVQDRDTDRELRDKKVVGSVAYMAPEQAASHAVGASADWYAVGVLLYQSLTGRLPIEGTPREVLREKQHKIPPRPRELRKEVPTDLEDLCMDLLRIEPAERPLGDEVLRRLGLGPVAAEAPAGADLGDEIFIGRRTELRELERAAEESRAGTGVLVLVKGDSGVGKSALVARFLHELAALQPDALVLAGHCYEHEAIPYKALDGVMDALSRALRQRPRSEVEPLLPEHASLLSQIFPVLARVEAIAAVPVAPTVREPHERSVRAFAALRTFLSRLAAQKLLVLLIEDLQWADADSLSLLDHVLRAPCAPPLLLIATWRDDAQPGASPSSPAAAALFSAARHLRLGPLPPAEAHALARLFAENSAAHPAADATYIATESGGHPLFIRELVRHAATRAADPQVSLAGALRARITRLDEGERRVLELCALSAGALDEDVAVRAAEIFRGPGDFWRTLSSLRAAALLRAAASGGDALEPYHDRVRAAVLAAMSPDAERARHLKLAEALLCAGRTEPEPLAHHFEGAGELERAAPYIVASAERAFSALAFERASALYKKALALQPNDPLAVRLRVRLGEALANAGQGAAAAAEYERALPHLSAVQALELRQRIADQLVRCGQTEAGLDILRDILHAVGITLPRSHGVAILRLLYDRLRLALRGFGYRERSESACDPADLHRLDALKIACNGLVSVDMLLATVIETRMLRLALDVGEPRRLAFNLTAESLRPTWSAGQPGINRARELLAQSRALAARLDDVELQAFFFLAEAEQNAAEERWQEARRFYERTIELYTARCVGRALETATMRLSLTQMLAMLGDLRELSEQVPAWHADAERRGDLHAAACASFGYSVLAWLVRDAPEEARRVAARAAGHLRGRTGWFLFSELLAQLHIDLYLGDGESARRRLRERWPERFMMRFRMYQIWCYELRGRSALCQALSSSRREKQRLLGEATQDARHIRREGSRWADSLAALLDAGIAAAQGDGARAAPLYRTAMVGFEHLDMRWNQRIAQRRLGELLGGSEGQVLRAESETWMDAQRVRNKDRMAQLIAPATPR